MSLEDIKFWQVVENFFFSSAVQSYGNFIAVFEFSTNFFKKNLTRKQKTGRQQAKICKYDCRQKRKCKHLQKRFSSSLQMFALYSFFLMHYNMINLIF